MTTSELRATMADIRRRVRSLQRKLVRELAVVKLRRIADAVANEWNPAEPPEPHAVIRRFADAGFILPTYNQLHQYLRSIIGAGEIPLPRAIVTNLLPWAWENRFQEFFRQDLPAQPSRRPTLPG